MAALRTLKAEEVAEHVADSIRQAVQQEVVVQLGKIKIEMLNLIDKVVELESHCVSRQSGAETPEVSGDPEVVQGPRIEGPDDHSSDGEGGSPIGGLYS